MQIFGGMCAALYHREHTGEGQKVEFNLYHTGVWMVGADIMDALFGLPLRRVDPAKSDNPFYDVYQCKDGRWLQLTAADRYAKAHDPAGAKFWQSFCRALDRPDLAEDPRFATTDMRQQHRDVLAPMLNEAFLEPHLRRVGGAPARREPHVRPHPLAGAGDRGPAGAGQRLLREVDQPGVGTIRTINSPYKFVQNPAFVHSLTPGLGEQTDEILTTSATATADIAELREAKVIL